MILDAGRILEDSEAILKTNSARRSTASGTPQFREAITALL